MKRNKGRGRRRRKNRSHPKAARARARYRRRNRSPVKLSKRDKASLLAQLRPRDSEGRFVSYKTNRKRGRRRRRRRNPLVANPLVANRRRGRRRNRRRGRRRNNPLVANRYRYNPLVANPRRRRRRRRGRRNPNGITGGLAQSLRQLPVAGGFLGAMAMSLGATAAGALSVYPTNWAMQWAGDFLPDQAKPFAYSIVGTSLAAAVEMFAPKGQTRDMQQYKGVLVGALAAAGGAVDAYRYITGTHMTLAGDMDAYDGEYDDDDEDWDGDYDAAEHYDDEPTLTAGEGPEWEGDDGYGDAENVRPGEWADASAYDAMYSGDDLSGEEMELAGMGRRAFRRRFFRRHPRAKRAAVRRAVHKRASRHAGTPGGRWAWLIYLIGFENFRRLSEMDPQRRRQYIQKARNEVIQTMNRAMETDVTDGDSTMEAMEAAGLLAA